IFEAVNLAATLWAPATMGRAVVTWRGIPYRLSSSGEIRHLVNSTGEAPPPRNITAQRTENNPSRDHNLSLNQDGGPGGVAMAGIAGWIHWRHNIQEQQGVLAGMLAALAHRGPDGQTLWLDEGSPAALGQRRRGSLDLTRRGRPPAPHWVLALDGEIYNLEQLREELARRGHPCPDGTPGEVVLQCYRTWGIACLQRLEGPFALALWDGTRRSLLLARDPLGIRPLLFARRGETLIFASEIKALLAHPHIRPQVDSQGLAELWLMGPGRTPGQGVFKGIGELRAGEFKTIGPGRAWRQRYWHL